MITNHSLIIINQRHQAHRRRRHATSVTLSTSSPKQFFLSLSVFKSPSYHDRHNHYLLLAIGH